MRRATRIHARRSLGGDILRRPGWQCAPAGHLFSCCRDNPAAPEDQTIALGMCQQLMDEVMGYPYMPAGGNPYATPLGATSSQRSGASRALFTAIGDFNGYRAMPPVDPWGIALGTDNGQGGTRATTLLAPNGRFVHWRQEVDVYYVNETSLTTALSGSGTSDYRAVEVRINYVDPTTGVTRTLAQLRRVVSYVPPLS